MPSIVLKKISRALHTRICQEARLHRRSMTQETIHVLEQGLGLRAEKFPRPLKGRTPLTQTLLDKAIKEGRA